MEIRYDEKQQHYFIKYKSRLEAVPINVFNTPQYQERLLKYKQQEEYFNTHKEQLTKYNKEYYAKHKEELNQRSREYAIEHKEEIALQNKFRKGYTPTKIFKYTKNTNPIKRAKFAHYLRVKISLKKLKYTGNEKIRISTNEFKQHIEKQFTPLMNWGNYGVYWEIGHKIPLSWFITEEIFNYGIHLNNIFPQEIHENREQKNCYALINGNKIYNKDDAIRTLFCSPYAIDETIIEKNS